VVVALVELGHDYETVICDDDEYVHGNDYGGVSVSVSVCHHGNEKGNEKENVKENVSVNEIRNEKRNVSHGHDDDVNGHDVCVYHATLSVSVNVVFDHVIVSMILKVTLNVYVAGVFVVTSFVGGYDVSSVPTDGVTPSVSVTTWGWVVKVSDRCYTVSRTSIQHEQNVRFCLYVLQGLECLPEHERVRPRQRPRETKRDQERPREKEPETQREREAEIHGERDRERMPRRLQRNEIEDMSVRA
jgi:hypothetical protein